MKVWKIRQYLPALLLHIQRRMGGERGFWSRCGRVMCVGWIGGAAWLYTAS
jgi:hypothetical protein